VGPDALLGLRRHLVEDHFGFNTLRGPAREVLQLLADSEWVRRVLGARQAASTALARGHFWGR
jgi:hypothetical protein